MSVRRQARSRARDRARPGRGVVGYVPGGWDMFHVGHLNILRRARAECDYLIAGVVTDEVLEQMKGRAPVVPEQERLEIVEHIRFVDAAVIDRSADKRVIWRQMKFDVLFKGDDWRETSKGIELEQTMGSVGARVVYFPYTVHTSSTLLRDALNG
jgi:glycerol-3-phosphate cytidylyltransferase